MSVHRLEELQVRVDGLVQELQDLPTESHEVAAASLLQRLQSDLAEHSLLLGSCARSDALDELQRRELARLVGVTLHARGDLARWFTALADLRSALDVILLGGDGRWGKDI